MERGIFSKVLWAKYDIKWQKCILLYICGFCIASIGAMCCSMSGFLDTGRRSYDGVIMSRLFTGLVIAIIGNYMSYAGVGAMLNKIKNGKRTHSCVAKIVAIGLSALICFMLSTIKEVIYQMKGSAPGISYWDYLYCMAIIRAIWKGIVGFENEKIIDSDTFSEEERKSGMY